MVNDLPRLDVEENKGTRRGKAEGVE